MPVHDIPDTDRRPAGPWDFAVLTRETSEIRMRAPRSMMPATSRYVLIGFAVAAALLSLRFLLIGAWPVILFSALDVGALGVAFHLFARGGVPEERLSVHGGTIRLVRSGGRGKEERIELPAYWTRLEVASWAPADFRLFLVFRQQRYPLGQCVSSAERRRIAPRVERALSSARRVRG